MERLSNSRPVQMFNLANASVDELADFIEVVSFANSGEPFGLSSIQNFFGTFASTPRDRANLAFNKIIRRKELFGDKYPLKVTNEYIVALEKAEESMYGSCLLVSPASPLRDMPSWSFDMAGKIFENAVETANCKFFGKETRTLNFGFPSTVGRPSDFDGAVKWLAQKMEVSLGSGYRQPRRKDGGVDIFIWKKFQDPNPGVPLLLLQCTIMEDYINKIGDIDKRLWASWLSSDIDPMDGLAVPAFVTEPRTWSEITTRGFLLDRRRLVAMSDIQSRIEQTELAFFRQCISELKKSFL